MSIQYVPVILPFRVLIYARAIYVYGTNRLTARTETINGEEVSFPGVAQGYYIAVQQYAAKTYTVAQLDLTLASGWITQQEYEETLTYKTTT